MKMCALDMEMNRGYPLAVGLAFDSKAGKLITIDQEGREPDWYVRKHICTDPQIWEGTTHVKFAWAIMFNAVKDYDIIWSWGKEVGHLMKFAEAAKADVRQLQHLAIRVSNAQRLFENPVKLQDMYKRFGSGRVLRWHNPLSDAIATLELGTLGFLHRLNIS